MYKMCDNCGGSGEVMDEKYGLYHVYHCHVCKGKGEIKLSPEEEIAEHQKKFRILKEWDIGYLDDGKYYGECCRNIETKKATIYPYWPDRGYKDDYFYHEVLHIAIGAMLKESGATHRYLEEMLVQDLSVLAGYKNVDLTNEQGE